MGKGRSQVLFELVCGVMLVGCFTLATGSTCEEISLDICTALPYTQTDFPNSFGHVSRDQIPPNLSSALQTLITIGCYGNAQLFLCAAAFPRCTASGQLLPPCRALCEGAVTGCGFWFGFYPDLFQGISCEAMPNSSDSNVCVGLNTSPVPKYNTTTYAISSGTNVIYSTDAVNTPNTAKTSETLNATPSPWQQTTSPSNEDKNESAEDKSEKPTDSTVFNLASLDFTSEVIWQRSTENKGGHKVTNSVDKAVKNEGGSNSQSAIPILGISVSVLSCVGLVVLLISCAFFRKAFGNPFGSTRCKPREGAFYTNPAFNDLPQAPGDAVKGQSSLQQHQPYTLDDLPPHPASVASNPRHSKHAQPNIYQQEPRGFTEQNLFAVQQSPRNHSVKTDSKVDIERVGPTQESYRVTRDLVYSNKVPGSPMDTNANDERGANAKSSVGNDGTAVAPSRGESFPMVSTNMDNGDMIIANPTAC